MYTAKITRKNPAAFIFLIDQSGSTEERMTFGKRLITKAEAIAMVTNMLLREIINRCRRDGNTLDYFDIAAVGYGGDGANMLLGSEFVKPSQLFIRPVTRKAIESEREFPDGSVRMCVDELRQWVEPRAAGLTPMRAAMEKALAIGHRWCGRAANRDSYPPTIFNITDGEASDADHNTLLELSEQIRWLSTSDGNALFINIHLSASLDDRSVLFPASVQELPENRYTRLLYDMSSDMPAEYSEIIWQLRGRVGQPPFRGMSCNASVADMITMLNIGSRSINRML